MQACRHASLRNVKSHAQNIKLGLLALERNIHQPKLNFAHDIDPVRIKLY